MAVSLIKPIALDDILINSSSIGMTNGKLSIAISVELLFAFAAMADTNVIAIDKPILPKNKALRNCPILRTGFSATTLKAKKDNKDKSSNKTTL